MLMPVRRLCDMRLVEKDGMRAFWVQRKWIMPMDSGPMAPVMMT